MSRKVHRFVHHFFRTAAVPARRGGPRGAKPRAVPPSLETLERRDCPSAGDWAEFGYNALGTHDNTQEHVLNASNASRLGVEWSFPTPAPVAATPVIANGTVYAGDLKGNFFALDLNGALKWQRSFADTQITGSALVTRGLVIFGDLAGDVYGLDAATGATRWVTHPNTSSDYTAEWGSPTLVGNNVAIGVASTEEVVSDPTHVFTSRGSVVLLDPSDGHVVWQTYTISDAAGAAGFSGSGVWSTPTYDSATHLLYVATGNYYSGDPNTPGDPHSEDAVLALDARDGHVVWQNQLFSGDVWHSGIAPGPDSPDADVGDSPKLFHLADGTEVVSVGQKSGQYYVINAATGAAVAADDLEVGGLVGGLFVNGAVDQRAGRVFQNGVHPTSDVFGAPATGDLYALDLQGNLLWDLATPAANGSAVAIANGVVYFQSEDGNLYALNESADSADTAVLATVPTNGNYSGPAISNGHVYLGGGNAALFYFRGMTDLTGSIVALGLRPAAADRLAGDVAALGQSLLNAQEAVAGRQGVAAVQGDVFSLIRDTGTVVGDLAAVNGVATPYLALGALDLSTEAYYLSLATGNDAGAAAALSAIKDDIGRVARGLSTSATDGQRLTSDLDAVFASLNQLFVDEVAGSTSATARDTAAELAALAAVINDVAAGRFGVGLS